MSQPSYRFEEFELDVESRELRRSGYPAKLEHIPMELLILLLQNPGKLVRREAINERLWGNDVFVETEHSINTAINKLRTILRDDSKEPRFIRTVIGQGYCFIAKVSVEHPVELVPSLVSAPAGISQTAVSIRGNGHSIGLSTETIPREDFRPRQLETRAPTLPVENPDRQTSDKPVTNSRWRVAGIAASLVALLIIAGVISLHLKRAEPQPAAQEAVVFRAVAVLPFDNLAQHPGQDYLVDGMTDQLITELSRRTALRVTSRRSAMQYKGVQKPIREIARELDVDAIVEGSYLRAGQQIRITAQLLDPRSDKHLWAQTYEESANNLLAMQDQVTNDIAHQVAIALDTGYTNSKLLHVNEAARDAYLRGRYLWNERTSRGLTDSIRYYTDAIHADPDYAAAYAALAESYALLSIYGDPHPADSLWKAQSAAEKALQLDGSLSQAHTALAAVKTDRDWNWVGAEMEFHRALQLNTADPTAHHWYALHLARLGRFTEAESEIRRAIALDPLSLIINTDAAEIEYWARKPHDAMARVDQVIALNPNFAQAHLVKGKVLEQQQQYQAAEDEFKEAEKLFGGGANIRSLQGHALALAGERDGALKIANDLEQRSRQSYVSGVHIAQIYCAMGSADESMKWLGRAYQQHDTGVNMLKVDPLFDGCRADPRFQELLRRLNLTS